MCISGSTTQIRSHFDIKTQLQLRQFNSLLYTLEWGSHRPTANSETTTRTKNNTGMDAKQTWRHPIDDGPTNKKQQMNLEVTGVASV